MDRGNTKQEILDAALDLFSIKGYEATSLSMIAAAVGIRKASLYNHFENKQAILDALVQEVLAQYNSRSLFARTAAPGTDTALTPEAAADLIREQVRFILHTPLVSKARKMLVIEQFQNPELSALQTKQNYSDVMQYFVGLMQGLIRRGVLAAEDPEIMAAQLCLPISVWINLCDREPDRESEVMDLIGRHTAQFFRAYQPKAEGPHE